MATPARSISTTHTARTSIAATFRVNGHYDSEALEKLNWFLRDWRNDEPTKMDPRLFDALWEAYRAAGRNDGAADPIIVLSAYRCPETNAMLRRRSRAVAEHSQHMLGKAMDTTMPGLSMEKLREIAMRMQRGGVGYYPNVPFVHIDVGGVRSWPRMNYDQLVRLFPDGKTVHLPTNGKPLPGYDEAKAEIEARGGETISVADANSGGFLGGFFSKLFGGGGEDEEEAREAVPVRPTRIARANPAPAPDPANASAARKMVATAESDLPRGETYLAPAAAPARQQVAALTPAPTAALAASAPLPPAKPTPLEEPPEEDKPAANAKTPAGADAPVADAPAVNLPLPPRRPDDLVAVSDAPLPPPRPAEFARLPEVITRGANGTSLALASPSSLGLRSSGAEAAPLAYAATPKVAPNAAPVSAPLPPARPAGLALRAAALSKAEERAAAKHAAEQMAPARVDRGALQAMVAPAPQTRAPSASRGGVAPALRKAAKLDPLAAPTGGAPTGFGAKAAQISANSFTKPAE